MTGIGLEIMIMNIEYEFSLTATVVRASPPLFVSIFLFLFFSSPELCQ